MNETTDRIASIHQRWEKRREPQIGRCQSCGHEREMAPSYQPLPSSLAEAQGKCARCGGQITVSFTINTADQSPEDDIAELLEILDAVEAEVARGRSLVAHFQEFGARQTERACRFNCDAESACECPAHKDYRAAVLAGDACPQVEETKDDQVSRVDSL